MENKIRKMEDKYALLSTRYEEKLQQYKDLLIKYQQLQAQIEDTQMPQNNRESKMEKLRIFINLKLGKLSKVNSSTKGNVSLVLQLCKLEIFNLPTIQMKTDFFFFSFILFTVLYLH